MDPKIIFEDKNIIVAEKPPKVPCQDDKSMDTSLLSILREHIKKNNPNLKKVYLEIVHRLDRPVGGIMVFPKTRESNQNLSKQISGRSFRKDYLAIVCGKPTEESMELTDYLKKLKTVNMSKVTTQDDKNAKKALLEYRVIETIDTEEFGHLSLLHIKLKTGRHHQIRVQLSHIGFPLWGDTKYNKEFMKRKDWSQIALWAYKLNFKHPVKKGYLNFSTLPGDTYPWNLFNLRKDLT
ncbi:MAG: RNA pseudouridine synthase [Anaeromicrobium sp.]|uniref:RluA family pseudouridine synthase n=1 Tax=Anaeromicrobium sp. TaxID=1929132 RepID=UPI0025D2BC71|nr:RNA pseudouridine synthase [Anaeromicrobium sp.]MCT4593390.1 RNA pseudouridine synthase [Anaeromicrobium sp.]